MPAFTDRQTRIDALGVSTEDKIIDAVRESFDKWQGR